jgi:hypothetical protein
MNIFTLSSTDEEELYRNRAYKHLCVSNPGVFLQTSPVLPLVHRMELPLFV